MKYQFLFFILIFLSISSFAIDQKSTNLTEKLTVSKQFNIDTIKSKIKIEPLQIEILTSKEKKESNNMPWIIALIVGVLTFIANIIASIVNRRISLGTIQTNKEIAIHQFNSTLKTKNRQDWIDNVRDTLSVFVSNCVKVNIEIQDPSETENRDKIKDIHEKIVLNRIKLQLLLNPEKELHNSILNLISEFIDILDKHMLNYENGLQKYDNDEFISAYIKIAESGRKLLYNEWQKIQKLTNEE